MAPIGKQKPIVYSPQIIYPNIRKRIIIHHGKNFKDFYTNNLYRSQFYTQFFNDNKYYSQFVNPNIS